MCRVRRRHGRDVKGAEALTGWRGDGSFAGEMPTHSHAPNEWSAGRRRRAEVIAHRGASHLRIENTLAAFAVALDQRADAIELDVHATLDGVVLVHHDPVPHGVHADGRSEREPISALRYVDVATIRIAGEPIPTLRDTLALIGDRATVYVEIKGAAIEPQVVAAIHAGGARCAIHSFDHDAVARIRILAPDIPRGLLFERGDPGDVINAMVAHDARDLWADSTMIDTALVEAAHRANKRLIAWTVNDATLAGRLAAIGIDGVCTDDVPRIGGALGCYYGD